MSRSKRHPVIVCSGQIDKDVAHKQVRKRVKMELLKDEPDEYVIEADTRDLQLEEWGTKYGFNVDAILDEEDMESYDRMRRK